MNEFNEGSADSFDASDAGPISSDDFFSDLSMAFDDGVESIDMGEDGSLDMRVRSTEPDEGDARQSAETGSVAPDADTPGSDTPDGRSSISDERYKEVQSWATRTAQENSDLKTQLAELRGMVQGLSTGKPGESDEADESGLEPEFQAQLDSYIARNLGQLLSEHLGVEPETVKQMQSEFSIVRELRQTMANHEDFAVYQPVISEIFQRNPNSDLNYEQAYQLARTFYDPAPASAGADGGNVVAPETPNPQGTPQSAAPKPTPQPSQEELEQRAQRVNTLASHTNDEGYTPERKVSSPRDAMLQALEEAGLE